jgi:hypothetical protein
MPTPKKLRPQDKRTAIIVEQALRVGRKQKLRSRADERGKDRDQLVKRLKKSGQSKEALALANRLEQCSYQYPCLSGACTECMARVQEWFASAASRALQQRGGPFKSLSLIPSKQDGQLKFKAWQRRFLRELREAGITFGGGGLDFSYNEDNRKGIRKADRFKTYRAIQLWFIGLSNEIDAARKILKKAKSFEPSTTTRRPIKTDAFNPARVEGLLYAFKPNFYRRESIIVAPKNGRGACQNSRKRELRVAQQIELSLALDQAGIVARLIILGAQIRQVGDSFEICPRQVKRRIYDSS